MRVLLNGTRCRALRWRPQLEVPPQKPCPLSKKKFTNASSPPAAVEGSAPVSDENHEPAAAPSTAEEQEAGRREFRRLLEAIVVKSEPVSQEGSVIPTPECKIGSVRDVSLNTRQREEGELNAAVSAPVPPEQVAPRLEEVAREEGNLQSLPENKCTGASATEVAADTLISIQMTPMRAEPVITTVALSPKEIDEIQSIAKSPLKAAATEEEPSLRASWCDD